MPFVDAEPRVLCENLFKRLSLEDPNELIRIIKEDNLRPSHLTFAAEYLGNVPTEIAMTALLDLLKHESAIVREGAIFGLSIVLTRHAETGEVTVTEKIREALKALQEDPSPGVRLTAKEVLQ